MKQINPYMIDPYNPINRAIAEDGSPITYNSAIGLATVTSYAGPFTGYTSGGNSPGVSDVIDKFLFSSDSNATDVGNLTEARGLVAGQSSTTYGYTSGGSATPGRVNTIDKFPFASDGNATDVGNITEIRDSSGGNSSSSHGYNVGGFRNPSPLVNNSDVIDKFPFSSDSNATDVGNLALARYGGAGVNSTTQGYHVGGTPRLTPPTTTRIDRFPFAKDGNSTSVATLGEFYQSAGFNSSTHGYFTGGSGPTYSASDIQKFPFPYGGGGISTIGSLTISRYGAAGSSSATDGYVAGGWLPISNVIDRFSFASEGEATDVGDLTQSRTFVAGQQG